MSIEPDEERIKRWTPTAKAHSVDRDSPDERFLGGGANDQVDLPPPR